ncbi:MULTISPECIES: flagellar biosynthetic protein FliO [Oceanibaculum]|uniref:Flagellar assembly protein FliO n=2 Tax=Oceanibaculum indicum TaxID=526216 RepID=K2KCJ3_9PROT|nr:MULTISPECIES: flagellar biosynthetic protein FliO [Oceanibaculum]EKE75025.1 flagellar assembly protein FliO [Oceanibaculum indicum P24]MCH2394925.1 flagellar biosynthetic protein FliO [Oceanibaculum sp.]RKQ72701.1 flagellar protein FliO/FliZ [Oceanibaculum indicum]
MNIESYLYAVLALVFVLALLGLFYLVMRRLGIGGALPRTRGERRLRLVEVLPVDAKRRLVLLRRDGREHLVLLGPESDLLIESLDEEEPDGTADFDAVLDRTPPAAKPATKATVAPAGPREPRLGRRPGTETAE